jgi:hypothetical protein
MDRRLREGVFYRSARLGSSTRIFILGPRLIYLSRRSECRRCFNYQKHHRSQHSNRPTYEVRHSAQLLLYKHGAYGLLLIKTGLSTESKPASVERVWDLAHLTMAGSLVLRTTMLRSQAGLSNGTSSVDYPGGASCEYRLGSPKMGYSLTA